MIEPSDAPDDESDRRHDDWLIRADWTEYTPEKLSPDLEN